MPGKCVGKYQRDQESGRNLETKIKSSLVKDISKYTENHQNIVLI